MKKRIIPNLGGNEFLAVLVIQNKVVNLYLLKKKKSISICNVKQPSTITQGLSIFPLYTNYTIYPRLLKKKVF